MSICYNVPLYLVTLIIFWSYYVFTYLYCIDYLINVAYKIILLIFYNIFFFLFVWCLWATALIRMYEVPFQYQVSARDHLILVQMKEADRHRILVDVCLRSGLRIYTRTPSGYLRYCTVCQHIKPDRTHHCTVCGRCVLKMDHHCPFVNNCVGLANYKHFVLMLLYGFIYTMYFASCTFPVVLKFCQLNSSAHKNYKQIQIVTGCFMAIIFWMLLGAFLGYHFSLVWKNETTLESLKDPVFVEPDLTFDMGVAMNLKLVFGSNCWLWFIPIGIGYEGDGVTFPVARTGNTYPLQMVA